MFTHDQVWALQVSELLKISLKIQFAVSKEKKQYSFSGEYTLSISYALQNT